MSDDDKIQGYPLFWPEGWPRTHYGRRVPSNYKVSFIKARDDLLRELSIAGARHVIVSTNIPLRRDGLPLAGQRAPEDPGVAVYWTDRKGAARVIACDVWQTVRENLRAVGLAYASIRQIERSGSTELLERAFAGFARLPAAPDCWSILGVSRGATREQIALRFRDLAAEHHPDRGGDPERFKRLSEAYHQALGAS